MSPDDLPTEFHTEQKFVGPRRIGHNLFSKAPGWPISVGIEEHRIEDCVDFINQYGYQGAFYFGGERDFDLQFLKDLGDIKSFEVTGSSSSNINGIFTLPKLVQLRIHIDKRPGIDFKCLKSLKRLDFSYSQKDRGLSTLSNLSRLIGQGCNTKSKTLLELDIPGTSLEILIFHLSTFTSLDGLPFMPRLRHIAFEYCRKLESAGSLSKQAPNLEDIYTLNCKKMTLSKFGIEELKKLQTCTIEGRRVLDKASGVFPKQEVTGNPTKGLTTKIFGKIALDMPEELYEGALEVGGNHVAVELVVEDDFIDLASSGALAERIKNIEKDIETAHRALQIDWELGESQSMTRQYLAHHLDNQTESMPPTSVDCVTIYLEDGEVEVSIDLRFSEIESDYTLCVKLTSEGVFKDLVVES